MEWHGEGVLLSARRHGETSAIIEVFTAAKGRHLGVVRGGAGRKSASFLQPGAQLDLRWRARLEDHIGRFTAEPLRSRAGAAMQSPPALAGLSAVTALLRFCLPERQPHPALYGHSIALLDGLDAMADWPLAYLLWEVALLEEMGYGLDLSTCAVTGAGDGLAFVSPRTGRAVSRVGAGKWADRLLPLPAVLIGAPGGLADILIGLRVTGHFLAAKMAADLGDKPLPEARTRLIARFTRQAAEGGGRIWGRP